MTTKKATPRVMRYARNYYNSFFKTMGLEPPTFKEAFFATLFWLVIFIEFLFYVLFIY